MDDKLTLIDTDTQFEGKLKGKDARILGRFKGEIELSGRLSTGEGSRIDATAVVGSAEIAGSFDGELKAASLVLLEKATITGKLETKSLAVREGARINGGVNAGAESKGKDAGAPRPATPGAPRG